MSSVVRSRAVAAVIAQVWQAGGSFVLQLLAAWALGAAGLGAFSLLYGAIILTTALGSGMVGDSLIVLNRADTSVRAGLQAWGLILAVGGMVVATVVAGASGLLGWADAAWFGLALAVFLAEELIRRMLMASLRFWHLVVVDAVALVGALCVVGALSLAGGLGIGSFLIGLCIGQVLALAVGVALLPSGERWLAPLRGAGLAHVARFGAWRGAQVAIPPLVLTLARTVVTLAVSAAALGEVEAARILVAPVTLAVQGFGSFLLSSYARDRDRGVAPLRRRAWRAAIGMMASALVVGVPIVLLTPAIGPLVGGSRLTVDPVVVAGWVCYVIATASLQPFASLGAVFGQQSRLFVCRLVDAAIAVVALILGVGLLGFSAAITPFVLGLGLAAGGVIVRWFVIRPLVHSGHSSRARDEEIIRSTNVAS